MRMCCMVLAALVLSGSAYAQEDDPLEKAAKQLGKSSGEYAGLSLSRQVNIQRLTTELERCGACAQRTDLERALATLKAEDDAVKAMEGGLLQSMGLQYDSFGSLLGALVADFTSGKLTTQQRQDRDIAAFNNMKRPVDLWCYIYHPSDAECDDRFLNKWSQELGVSRTSDDFGWAMFWRNAKTTSLCQHSIRALRGGGLQMPMSNDPDVRACEGPLSEWARLRNEADAFCIEHGASRTMRDGRVVAYEHGCRNLIRKRDNQTRFPTTPKRRR